MKNWYKPLRQSGNLLIICLLIFPASNAWSQFYGSSPRTSLGIEAAEFRVSFDNFDNVFNSRWGFAWGGHASVRISSTYNIVAKYRQYNKSDQVQIAGASQEVDWQQRWINAGVRYIRLPDRGPMNFFGFGLTFMNLEGTGVPLVLPNNSKTADGKDSATGFFLDFGFGYPILPKTYFLIQIELTSVGIAGSGGLESSSIGGIYLGAGLNIFPF